VKYQIMVMFMIAAGTALASMGIALLVYRRLFNRRHQLRWDRIRRKE
jgi:putative ABC transport system permease protein